MNLETFLRGVGWLIVAYAVLGAGFATVVQGRGLPKFDPGTQGTSVAFRLILLPGMIALWPLLVWRWKTATRHPPFQPNQDLSATPRRLRALHRLGWQALAVAAPPLVALALFQRPPAAPSTPDAQRLRNSVAVEEPAKESPAPGQPPARR